MALVDGLVYSIVVYTGLAHFLGLSLGIFTWFDEEPEEASRCTLLLHWARLLGLESLGNLALTFGGYIPMSSFSRDAFCW